MTKISEIYDALETVIVTALPNYKPLRQPYVLERNADIYSSGAYGIRFATSTNFNQFEEAGILRQTRTLEVVQFLRLFANPNDRETRETTEKQLFEDQKLIIDGIYGRQDLGVATVEARYSGDSGIEFADATSGTGPRVDLLRLITSLDIDYFEKVPICN